MKTLRGFGATSLQSSCTLEDKTADKVVFRNDRDTDHTVPYTNKQTTVSTVDAEIKYGMQLEMENDMKQADLNLSGVVQQQRNSRNAIG